MLGQHLLAGSDPFSECLLFEYVYHYYHGWPSLGGTTKTDFVAFVSDGELTMCQEIWC